MPRKYLRRAAGCALAFVFLPAWCAAKSPVEPAIKVASGDLAIPRLDKPPVLEDFLSMAPSPAVAGKLTRVSDFVQYQPTDGAKASQRTEAYVGYDARNLYVVFICFDSNPAQIRAHMTRRDNVYGDDFVDILIDSYHDQRHGVSFVANPLGVQLDRIWSDQLGWDESFDTVWDSWGKLTPQGYVAEIAIPFRSLRFPAAPRQIWGIQLHRSIARNNEDSFWPRYTQNVQGRLTQAAVATGIENVSPGRNMQFNPYVSFRSFKSLDTRDPSAPAFFQRSAQLEGGMDSKFVIHDSLVLDTTINPDFAQVESDEPQTTVNQRFEVFFPEKRPFFLENSTFFKTPIDLAFTRRIAAPEAGARLTGKLGPWGIGMLLIDDTSPGKSVPDSDPLHGQKAYFGIFRFTREFGSDLTLGAIYADRELHTDGATVCTALRCTVGFSRVGGIDGRLKFKTKWVAEFQALESDTKMNDGSRHSGPGYQFFLERSSSKLEYNLLFKDNSPGFDTQTGFFQRPDIRRLSQFVQYRLRREGKLLQWHGPSFFTVYNLDHNGVRLEYVAESNYQFQFKGQTNLGVYGHIEHDRLRPVDFDTLTADRDYPVTMAGAWVNFGYFKQWQAYAESNWGANINFVPAAGPPLPARQQWASATLAFFPVKGLTVNNTYILTRLQDQRSGLNIFDSHILRSKWNYQFTRSFSLRIIGQYNAVLSNPLFTSQQTTKNFNADVLFTYLVHPGTAVYVGYNSNLENLLRPLGADLNDNLLRTNTRYLNDGHTIFLKLSYLIRR